MHVLCSEAKKLATLPAMHIAAGSTIVFSAVVSMVFRSRFGDQGLFISTDVLRIVPDYISIGLIVFGSLSSSHEYSGGQIMTSLVALPQRSMLAATKSAVVVVASYSLSLVSMAVSAVLTQDSLGVQVLSIVLNSSVHLTIMTMLSFYLGLLIRSIVPTLTISLVVLVVAPPMLMPVAGWVKWFPSELSSGQFVAAHPVFTISTVVPLLCWIVFIMAAGIGRMQVCDAC